MEDSLSYLDDSTGYKKIILRLRWVTIIVTSYLILFGRGITSPHLLPALMIFLYLLSNLFAYFIPPSYFLKLHFFYIILLIDIAMASLGIYLTAQFNTDFYMVFFLIIFSASIAKSLKLLVVSAIVACGVYGWFLWSKGIDLWDLEKGILLRIPFIFVMNLFYGFLIQSFEERMRRVKKNLREIERSEQRYRQIVESAHDAVAILDEKNQIKFFNRRLFYLTQYTSYELTGMDMATILSGLGKEKGNPNFLLNIGSGGNLESDEAEVVQKNGERKKVEVSASQFSLPDRSGNYKPYTIIYLRDLTEKKQIEEKLSESGRLRALGEMAAGIAHDLNNILGAILGRAQLIKLDFIKRRSETEKMSDEVILQELEIIEQATIDGAQRIKKILEFTRLKPDEPTFTLLDVNEIVEEATELVKTKIKDEAEAKGIQIEVRKVLDKVLPVMGSSSELKEVLVNMLLNSIDSMPEGGMITIKTKMENSVASIEVSDYGIGMADSVRHKVFDPFFTTKGIQRSGVGLSIANNIIHRHRGEILVKSMEGVGTNFKIKLPIATKVELELTKEGIAEPIQHSFTILVIDDDPRVLTLLSNILVFAGYQVIEASNANSVIEYIEKGDFDMVLTDLGMPMMNGWEIVKLVKAKNPQIPIGLITGWGTDLEEAKMIDSGVDIILEKPFQVHEILKAVHQFANKN